MPVIQNDNSKSKKKRGWVIFTAGCGVLTVIIIVLLVIYLAIGWQSYQNAPYVINEVESENLVIEEYDLGQDQIDAYLGYGFPEAFRILFYDETLPDGSIGPVRLESWTYYTLGVELTFLNGEKSGEESLNISQFSTLKLPPYYPEQFSAYMSLAEVMTAAGLDQYAVIPLEKDYLEGSEVYYGPHLSFGMKDGELRMVEVMGIIE